MGAIVVAAEAALAVVSRGVVVCAANASLELSLHAAMASTATAASMAGKTRFSVGDVLLIGEAMVDGVAK